MSRGVFVVRDHLARIARERGAPQDFDLGPRFAEVTEIGRGGTARVVSALDRLTGRRVAVKMLERAHAASPLFQARFEHELALHEGLCVRGVVRALGRAETPDGRSLLILELLDGDTARSLEGASDVALLEALLEIAHALGALHRAGVVHLDVKPDNIMSSSRGAQLIDLGLARRATDRTEPVGVTGTPPYAAPEVVLGAELDARTDVFALGVTALELLTGVLPWSDVGGSVEKLWMAPLHTPAPRLRRLRPELPDDLDEALALATEPDRRDRHMDITTLAAVFERALGRASTKSPGAARNVIPLTTGFEETRRIA